MLAPGRRFVAVIGGAVSVARICMAQEFNLPTFYASFPAGTAIPAPPAGQEQSAPSILNVVHVWTFGHSADPVQVADDAVQEVLNRLYVTHTLQPDKICLNLIGLGHTKEQFECEGNPPNWVDHRQDGNRYFTESDRLPGLDDYEGDITATPHVHWPVARQDPPCCPLSACGQDGWFASDYTAARAYRHPFLANARDGGLLRNWCAAFIQRYRDVQTYRLQNNLDPLPDPDMLVVVDESWIFLPGAGDGTFMLWFLATHGPYWSNPNQDPRWYVPGYPAGTTLASLYADFRASHAPSLDIPANILDAIGPFGQPPTFHPEGDKEVRAIMLWWLEVTARAIDAVWQKSLYSVAHASWAWPQTNTYGEYRVKCSNYGVARWDGAVDFTGWFRDRDCDREPWWCQCGSNPCQQPTRHTANRLPRGFIEPQGGQFMYREPQADPNPLRWLVHTGWCSADVDSLYLYWLRFPQYDPAPCGGGWQVETLCNYACNCQYSCEWCSQVEGHKQLDQYLPGNPPETLRRAAQRIHRHAVASDLNSDFGSSTINPFPQRHRRPWPWIEPAWNNNGNNPYGYGAITPNDMRIFLSDRRADNLRGFNVWPDGSQNHDGVMQDTAEVIYQVYAPRIFNYLVLHGNEITPQAHSPGDPTLLEFTLRGDDQQPRTVDVEYDSSMSISEILVAFDNLSPYWTNACGGVGHPCPPCNIQTVPPTPCPRVLPADPLYAGKYYDYLILVEDSTNSPGVYGFVLAFDFAAGNWVKVMVRTSDDDEDAGTESSYDYFTPDRTSRRTFVLSAGDDTDAQFVSNDGWMLLKLVQVAYQANPPVAKYDRVQVIPYPARVTGGGGFSSVKQSDINYDGVVTAGDLGRFLQDWFAQKPAADMNMDGRVDEADLAKYLAAYATGS